MRFQKHEGEVELCGRVRDVELCAESSKFAAAVVYGRGRNKASGGFSGTSRIYDVHIDAQAGIGGKANKVRGIDVFKAGVIHKSESDAVAEREVSRLRCTLG